MAIRLQFFQVHNYFSPLCRTEMFDKDVLILQVCNRQLHVFEQNSQYRMVAIYHGCICFKVGAALMDPNEFMIKVAHKFGLYNWLQ